MCWGKVQEPELPTSRIEQGHPRKGSQKQEEPQRSNSPTQSQPVTHTLHKFLTQHLRQAVGQLWCVNMETGTGGGGSSRWPEPAPGKNGKSCLSWRLPQRHILPLYSFFSAEYPLCFSTGQVPTYPQARELCNSWELHDEMCCLP